MGSMKGGHIESVYIALVFGGRPEQRPWFRFWWGGARRRWIWVWVLGAWVGAMGIILALSAWGIL